MEAREIGEAAKINETATSQTRTHVSSANNWSRNTIFTASVLFNQSGRRNLNVRCIYCKGTLFGLMQQSGGYQLAKADS